MFLLTLAGSNASAATVPLEKADSLAATMTGAGMIAEASTLESDMSGAALPQSFWENSEGGQSGSLDPDELIQVPPPAAAWLLASVIVGFALVARRRDWRNSPVA